MSPNGELIGPGDAARILAIGRATLYRWAKAGKVRHYELGPYKRMRFDKEDILALLRERGGGEPKESG